MPRDRLVVKSLRAPTKNLKKELHGKPSKAQPSVDEAPKTRRKHPTLVAMRHLQKDADLEVLPTVAMYDLVKYYMGKASRSKPLRLSENGLAAITSYVSHTCTAKAREMGKFLAFAQRCTLKPELVESTS